MDPARTIIRRLGGAPAVAAIAGTALTAPYRWQTPIERGGTGGVIPQRHHRALLDFASARGIALTAEDFLRRDGSTDPRPRRKAAPGDGKANPMTRPAPASAEMPPAVAIGIRDVVTIVANLLDLSPQELLADLGEKASRGRRIAAACVVRRSQVSAATAARQFGVTELMVGAALLTLDAVLTATQASITHAPLVPLLTRIVDEWSRFEETPRGRIAIGEVQGIVAGVCGCPADAMRSARRNAELVVPRHIAIYLASRFTLRSTAEIARAFSRDDTTILYAVNKVRPHADSLAAHMAPDASVEEWARALRELMQHTGKGGGTATPQGSPLAAEESDFGKHQHHHKQQPA